VLPLCFLLFRLVKPIFAPFSSSRSGHAFLRHSQDPDVRQGALPAGDTPPISRKDRPFGFLEFPLRPRLEVRFFPVTSPADGPSWDFALEGEGFSPRFFLFSERLPFSFDMPLVVVFPPFLCFELPRDGHFSVRTSTSQLTREVARASSAG